jgi:CRISPR-associated protein (TIGR03984 family)
MTWRDLDQPAGCTIEPLDEAACGALLDQLTGTGDAPDPARPWLLAHTDGGVVWGRRDPGDAWRLSSDAFPHACPRLATGGVQQARVFGDADEILLWRTPAGMHGRRLADLPHSGSPDGDTERPATWLAPYEQPYLLLADRLLEEPRQGFSLVGDAAGSRQAVPLTCEPGWFSGGRWPLALRVRHYLQADRDTGAVRVAASRLAGLVFPRER